ncbi:MAG: MG2 domain-containing protein [Treponema sp.]
MSIKLRKFFSVFVLALLCAGCESKSKILAQTVLSSSEKNMSAEESEAFLNNFSADFTEQSELEIKKSREEAIRNLAGYKTKYNVLRSDVSSAVRAVQTVLSKESYEGKNSDSKVFCVTDWGPANEIPGNMNRPVFFVLFSLPVKELAALSDDVDGKEIFTVTPPVKGKYRWTGSRQLNFIPEEELEPSQVYTIQVNSKLKSLDGAAISGELTFSSKAQSVEITSILPGSSMTRSFYYDKKSGVPVEYAGDLIVFLNSKINAKKFKEAVKAYAGENPLSLSSTPIESFYDEKTKRSKYREVSSSRVHYVKLGGKFEKNQTVSLVAESGRQKEYSVLKPFELTRCNFDSYNMTLEFSFNQPVKDFSAVRHISIEPPLDLSKADVTVSGKKVYIRGLPVEYDSGYSGSLSKEITDKYNQKLVTSFGFDFKVPKAASIFKMIDNGNKILEAQYPHKFIIEHQNLLRGSYSIKSVEDPLSMNSSSAGSKKITLDTALDNKRHFEEIELDPYLKYGLGFVRINVNAVTHSWNNWNEKYYDYEYFRDVNIQVTDLGVTARAGYNKVVALVKRLSDDSPVANAKVYLYENSDYSEENLSEALVNNFGTGYTDKNGYVEFDVSKKNQSYFLNASKNRDLCLFVQKDNDKVTYPLDNHSVWEFGISSSNFYNAYIKNKNIIFLFTDRGLYRPGETVSFRGIARSLTRDGLKTMSGEYKCEFKKKSWNDEELYGTSKGILSGSGGFYGSFKIPEDIKPGEYAIEFYKDEKCLSSEYFTVAYFEKVKFQTSATIPDLNYTLGESVSAELSASYLAGGALSGASYEASWYRQATDFIPPVPEADNYVFGPANDNRSPEMVSQVNGKVNEDGVTRISCNTEEGVVGQSYVYRSEIKVTDISNQSIYTGAAKVIHPGMFYIGAIKRFANGFPKSKEKLEIPFALFKPDGTYAPSTLVNGTIEYSVNRSCWSFINEDAVDGVYSHWQRVSEEITSGAVDASSKGVISFVPEKAGFYTVSITAKDRKNNCIKTDKCFYVTGYDYYWFDSDNASALRLSPDKNKYKPGETARLLLESPLAEGDYIITVERDSILSSELRHIDSSCTQIEIPVKEEYLPVVYVSICSYSVRKEKPSHQYGETDLGKPKGYYGVTALNVDLKTASFDVEVSKEKQTYRPGEKITLELKATKNGRPLKNAELTVMVVDRAVIDLINYHVKDPLSYFYNSSNYPLCVIGGDSRNLLMDPVTYKVKSLQGGDSLSMNTLMEGAASASEKEIERKDFKPTALFEPVVMTDKNGIAKVTFTLPDSLTTYRVTAFGVAGNDFSLNESEVQVQNLINVQAVQPRRLRVRDTAEAGVIVTNLDSKAHDVSVGISVRAPLSNYESDTAKGLVTKNGQAFIDGKNQQTVTVPAGKTMPVYFNVAASSAGNVELVYDVKSDVLKEKLVSKILIEKSYVYETVALTGTVESESNKKSGKSSQTEKIFIPGWCEDGVGELEITLDPSQIGLMGSSVRYVFDYPYGCLEQQSSKIWPMIIFGDYIDVFGLKSNVDDPRQVVKNWFASVKKEQHANGSFPYWPGSSWDNEYVSLRFAHMYQLALERGYSSAEIGYDINSLKTYLAKSIEKHNLSHAGTYTAYACYVFSLLGDSRLDKVLDALYDECKKNAGEKSLAMLAYVGLAYEHHNNGTSKKRAKEIANIIRSYIKPNNRSVSIDKAYNCGYDYFGMYDNESEGLASVLQLFVEQKPNDILVNKILFTLLQKQKAGYWQNTATTARVFEAISVLIEKRNLDSLDFISSAVIKNPDGAQNVLVQDKFKGLGAKPAVKTYLFGDNELKNIPHNKTADIEFTKDGTGTLYYSALMKYAIPDELCNARDEGFEILYKISDENGNEVTPPSPDSKVIVLDSGKTYKIDVTVITSQARNYVALRVPVPSGAEIVDSALSTGASKNTSGDKVQSQYEWDYDYDDEYFWYSDKYEYFYDNEAQYFENFMRYGTYQRTVTVRASRRGVYPVPPVQAECMYEPEIFGRSDGFLFIIK